MRHLTNQQLCAHLDGELVGPSLQLVERHLGECVSCRLAFQRLQERDADLLGLLTVESDAAFHEKLLDALAGEVARTKPERRGKTPPWRGAPPESRPFQASGRRPEPAVLERRGEPIDPEPPPSAERPRPDPIEPPAPPEPPREDPPEKPDPGHPETPVPIEEPERPKPMDLPGEKKPEPTPSPDPIDPPADEPPMRAEVEGEERQERALGQPAAPELPVAGPEPEPPSAAEIALAFFDAPFEPAAAGVRGHERGRPHEPAARPEPEPVFEVPAETVAGPDPEVSRNERRFGSESFPHPWLIAAGVLLLTAAIAGVMLRQQIGEWMRGAGIETRVASQGSDAAAALSAAEQVAPSQGSTPDSIPGTAPRVEVAPRIDPARGRAEPSPLADPSPRPTPSPRTRTTGKSAFGLLCGEVRDQDGAPVAGAQVMMADVGVVVVTDRWGRFCLAAPVGTRTLTVLAVGFDALHRPVSIASRTPEIALQISSSQPFPTASEPPDSVPPSSP